MNYEEFKGEQLKQITFTGNKFAGVDLKFSSFTKCVFDSCDFTGSLFDGTSFEDCSFPGSKLSNLDFAPVIFIKCNFREAVIENSIFQHMKTGTKNEVVRYDLRECIFDNVTMNNSVFIKCDFEAIDFAGSKLIGAIFDRCKLTRTRFVEADISGANFEGSIIDQTELDTLGFVQYGNSRGFKLC